MVNHDLPYLTDEELATLRAHPVRRTYSWTRYGQRYSVAVRFVMASASYIDVHYNGHPIDCINVWDEDRRVPLVRTPAQLRAAADAYWTDEAQVRDMIRGGLGLPLTQRDLKGSTMTDDEVLALFDRLAARDYNIHDYNRWGTSYFQRREEYRSNPRTYDPARLATSDRSIIDALGDDPEVLFEFATSTNGYYYGGATLHDEGYGNLREDLIGKYGPDAPTTHLNMFREEHRR